MGVTPGSLILREEPRLRVFGNRVLREILGFMRDNVAGEWGGITQWFFLSVLNTEYYLGDQIKKNGMAGACSAVGERSLYRMMVVKPCGKRPVGRPWRRWDNITMGFQEVGWGARTGMMWLRTGTGGGRLWMRGISLHSEDLSVSQGHCSKQLVWPDRADNISTMLFYPRWVFLGQISMVLH